MFFYLLLYLSSCTATLKHCDSHSDPSSPKQSARQKQSEQNKLLIRSDRSAHDGPVLLVKDGIDVGWVPESDGVLPGKVSSFQISGNYIAALTTDGKLFAKEGLSGRWVPENPDHDPICGESIVESLGKITSFRLSNDRIAALDDDGVLHTKEGIISNWKLQERNEFARKIMEFQINEIRLCVLSKDGKVFAKNWNDYYWIQENSGLLTGQVSKIQLGGDRIGVVAMGITPLKQNTQSKYTARIIDFQISEKTLYAGESALLTIFMDKRAPTGTIVQFFYGYTGNELTIKSRPLIYIFDSSKDCFQVPIVLDPANVESQKISITACGPNFSHKSLTLVIVNP